MKSARTVEVETKTVQTITTYIKVEELCALLGLPAGAKITSLLNDFDREYSSEYESPDKIETIVFTFTETSTVVNATIVPA
jgi:NADH:ubiquinone oxidoreductase subunit F (NADH-binding)